MTGILTARAHPRVGLLGNPSDGYGGSTLGFAFADFRTDAFLAPSDRVTVRGLEGDARDAADWRALVAVLPRRGGPDEPPRGGAALLTAAVAKFADHCESRGRTAALDRSGFTLSFESDVPMQVGLAGSSAIVVAALRVLSQRFGVELAPFELSELALLAETEELSIAAGPQDRVIQAYQGLLYMDFATGRAPEHYRALDPALLPPCFVAWDPEPGVSSGKLHDDVRRRWEAGDPKVCEALATFPRLAAEGVERLLAGDHERFRELVDLNFDTRASIWPLRARDRELVAIGRAEGAAVKFSGSGGAAVGVLAEESSWPAIQAAYRAAGFDALRPRVIDAAGSMLPR